MFAFRFTFTVYPYFYSMPQINSTSSQTMKSLTDHPKLKPSNFSTQIQPSFTLNPHHVLKQSYSDSKFADIAKISPMKVAAYFKHQSLVSGSSGVKALRLVERTLIIEDSPTKIEPPWPIHSPIPGQVVLFLQGTDSQVAGGHLHFLDMDAPCSSWHCHHRVILWERMSGKESPVKMCLLAAL